MVVIPRCFRWSATRLINTQLQLGVWRAEGHFNRFSGFPSWVAVWLRKAMRLAERETVETVEASPQLATTQLKLGVNETAVGERPCIPLETAKNRFLHHSAINHSVVAA